jgi:hypothetical protein
MHALAPIVEDVAAGILTLSAIRLLFGMAARTIVRPFPCEWVDDRSTYGPWFEEIEDPDWWDSHTIIYDEYGQTLVFTRSELGEV